MDSRQQIYSFIDSQITDPTNQQNTAAVMRAVLKYIVQNAANLADDELGVNPNPDPTGFEWDTKPSLSIEGETVSVSVGLAGLNGEPVFFDAASFPVELPSEGNTRIDAVFARPDGTYGYTYGTAGEHGVTPKIPDGTLLAGYTIWAATGGAVTEPPIGLTLEQVQELLGDYYDKKQIDALMLGRFRLLQPSGEHVYGNDAQALMDNAEVGSTLELFDDVAALVHRNGVTISTNGHIITSLTDTESSGNLLVQGSGEVRRINLTFPTTRARFDCKLDFSTQTAVSIAGCGYFEAQQTIKVGGSSILHFRNGVEAVVMAGGHSGWRSQDHDNTTPVGTGGAVFLLHSSFTGRVTVRGLVKSHGWAAKLIDVKSSAAGMLVLEDVQMVNDHEHQGNFSGTSYSCIHYESNANTDIVFRGIASLYSDGGPVIRALKDITVRVEGNLYYNTAPLRVTWLPTTPNSVIGATSTLTNGSNTFALTETGTVLLNGVEFTTGGEVDPNALSFSTDTFEI